MFSFSLQSYEMFEKTAKRENDIRKREIKAFKENCVVAKEVILLD